MGAVVVNLFGEVELWDDVDQYLDGLPPKKVLIVDEVTDPNLKGVLTEDVVADLK